jgi:hypothetical protein
MTSGSLEFVEFLTKFSLSVVKVCLDLKSNQERLSEIERNIQSTIEIHRESLSTLQSNFEHVTEHLSVIEREFRELMATSESDILRIESHSTSFENHIMNNVDNMSNGLNSIIERENRNEQNLISIRERVNVVESEIGILRSELQTLHGLSDDVVQLQNALNSVRTDTQSTEMRFSNEFTARLNNQEIELRRLSESVRNLNPPEIVGGFRASDSIQIFVPGSSPLSEGIISYLTRQCGGNVCDHQCIHAFSESVHSPPHQPKNVVDFLTDTHFCSKNHPNQSIGYDFKYNQRIRPTHYAIRSVVGWRQNQEHPKSWVIEVTNDRWNENSWIEIDRCENNHELNEPGIVQTFPISHPPNSEFRFIRLRQIDINHASTHYLGMTAFELFGQLRICTAVPL